MQPERTAAVRNATPGSAGVPPAEPPYEPSPLSGLEAHDPRPLHRHSSGAAQAHATRTDGRSTERNPRERGHPARRTSLRTFASQRAGSPHSQAAPPPFFRRSATPMQLERTAAVRNATPGSAGVPPAEPPYEPSPLIGLEAHDPRPLHGQSSGAAQRPACTGLCSTYATAVRKWRSFRMARSKYSCIQKLPLRPSCLLASLAVKDFQE